MNTNTWRNKEIKTIPFKKLFVNIDENLLYDQLYRIHDFFISQKMKITFSNIPVVYLEFLTRIIDSKERLNEINGKCKDIARKIFNLLHSNKDIHVVSVCSRDAFGKDSLIYQKVLTPENTYNNDFTKDTDIEYPNTAQNSPLIGGKRKIQYYDYDPHSSEQVFSVKRSKKNKRKPFSTNVASTSRGVESIRIVSTYSSPKVSGIKFESGGIKNPTPEQSKAIDKTVKNAGNAKNNETIAKTPLRQKITNFLDAINRKEVTNGDNKRDIGKGVSDKGVLNNNIKTEPMDIDNKMTVNMSTKTSRKPKSSSSTTTSNNNNNSPTIRMKTIAALQKPIEIDKSIRMMNLMGWKGGALGARQDGITEPIMPALDLVNRAGLGHVKKTKPEDSKRAENTSTKTSSQSNNKNVQPMPPSTSIRDTQAYTPKCRKPSVSAKRVPTLFRQQFLRHVLELVAGDDDARVIAYDSRLQDKEKNFIKNAIKCFSARKEVHLASSDEMQIVLEINRILDQVPDLIVTCTMENRCEVQLKKNKTQLISKGEMRRLGKVLNKEVTQHSGVSDGVALCDDIDALLAACHHTTATKRCNDNLKFRIEIQQKILLFLKSTDKVLEILFDTSLNLKQARNISLLIDSINKRIRFGCTKVERVICVDMLKHVRNVYLDLNINNDFTLLTITKVAELSDAKRNIANNTNNIINIQTNSTPVLTKSNNLDKYSFPFGENFSQVRPVAMETDPVLVKNNTPSIFTQNIFTIPQSTTVVEYTNINEEIMRDISTNKLNENSIENCLFVDNDKCNKGIVNLDNNIENNKNICDNINKNTGDSTKIVFRQEYDNNLGDSENNLTNNEKVDININKTVQIDNNYVIDEAIYPKIDWNEMKNSHKVDLNDKSTSITENLSEATHNVSNANKTDSNTKKVIIKVSKPDEIKAKLKNVEKEVFVLNDDHLKLNESENSTSDEKKNGVFNKDEHTNTNKDKKNCSNSNDDEVSKTEYATSDKNQLESVNQSDNESVNIDKQDNSDKYEQHDSITENDLENSLLNDNDSSYENYDDIFKENVEDTSIESENESFNANILDDFDKNQHVVPNKYDQDDNSNEKLQNSTKNEDLLLETSSVNINNKSSESIITTPDLESPVNDRVLCIVHRDHPEVSITDNQIKEVQLTISTNIQMMKKLPLLKCHGVQNNVLIYSCHDNVGRDFLKTVLCVASSVKILPLSINTLEFRMQCFFDFEVPYLFKMIELYNEGLSTTEWKVLNVDTSLDSMGLIVKMDQASIDYILDSNFSLFIGIDKVDINIYLS